MGHRGFLSPVVIEIVQVCKKASAQGHSIVFQWIPVHVGISGNEDADRTAVGVHQYTRRVPIILSRGDRRYLVSSLTSSTMQSQWQRDITTHSLLYSVDPTLSLTLPRRIPRSFITVFHRMWLNVAFTPAFKHLLGVGASSLCSTCGVRGDLHHVLLVCGQYERERALMETALQRVDQRQFDFLGPWSDPSHLMQGPRAVAEFLSSTGLMDEL
ncbi:uncharacterized protein LOC135389215 [Ornithodoros turicata]|uniref:uncharacterized protein LOC135389215 n=1 Tax=Ornithodoros turicata TaxID=34597 RepID=UPI0031394630